MKHLLISLCVFLLGSVLYAQDVRIAMGCKKNPTGSNPVVQLKFMFPATVVSPYSINVFRKKVPDGTWEKINSAPLEKTAVVAKEKLKSSPKAGDAAFSSYQGFLHHKPSGSAEDEKNYKVFAGLMALSSNAFATYAGCYMEDVTAVNGVTYQYRITNAKNADKELAVSSPFIVSLSYLSPISDLTGKQRKDFVYLNWSKQKQFYKYKVYRKNSLSDAPVLITKRPVLLGQMTGDSLKSTFDLYKYMDSAGIAGTKVYYQVSGIDVMENESVLSKETLVEIRDMVPPNSVSDVKVERKGNDVALAWKVVADKDCSGYNIYRSTISDTAFKKINSAILPATSGSYIDHNLPEGTNYAYCIESVDAAGNTSRSRVYKVFFPDVTPPAKPVGLKGAATPGIIKLTWSKNPEADMLGYFLYRASTKDNRSYFNLISKAAIKGNSFTDTLPGVAKNEFVYYIQAIDKHYNKSTNSDTIVVHLPDTLAPHSPWITDIKADGRTVTLRWKKPSDNDVVGYDIYRSEDSLNSGNYRKVNAAAVSGLTFADNGTTGNKAYYYYVKAKDDANNTSKPSNIKAIFIEPDTASLKAAVNIRADFSKADSSVHIAWSNESKDVMGYIIFRKEDEAHTFVPISAMLSNPRFVDKNVQPGTSYQYMVRSFFASADVYKNSAVSNVLSVN